MRRHLVLTAVLLLSLAPGAARGPLDREPAMAATRIYYGPAEGFDRVDPDLIGRARSTIDMAAYVLTQRPVIDALEAAVRRGVRLRLYLDADQRDPQDGEPRERLAALLRMPGVETRFKATSRDIMHFKAYQVDGRFLRTGSANFSFSGSRRQDNDIIVLESTEAVGAFALKFQQIWTRRDNDPFRP